MVLPASVADVGSMIALAMNVIGRRPNGPRVNPEACPASLALARAWSRAERSPPHRAAQPPDSYLLRASRRGNSSRHCRCTGDLRAIKPHP